MNATRAAERYGISVRAFIVGPLKQVIEDEGWRAGSDLEILVVSHLRGFHLKPTQVVQEYAVRPEGSESTYRLDFAWPSIKVALEADGWHHRSPNGAASDRQRDSELRADDWLVFRVDDEHGEDALMMQVGRVLQVVRMLGAKELLPQRLPKPKKG